MTRVFVVKGSDGALRPFTDEDKAVIDKWSPGMALAVDIKRPRNPKHHAKGMAMLRFVFDNQDKVSQWEHFLIEVKLLTGHVDSYVTSDGQLMYIQKSINFENMDEDAFSEWRQNALQAVLDHFLPHIRDEERDRVVDTVLGFM